MKQERILIAEDYNNQLSSNFYFAIRQLRKTLTNEKLGEVGLTLDSNVLRDILSGGNETETKVRKTQRTAFKRLSTSGSQKKQRGINRKVTKGLSDNGNKG